MRSRSPASARAAARRRDRRPVEPLPVVERVRFEVARLQTQIGLLQSVRSWYLAPLALGGLAWVLSLAWAAPVEAALRWGILGVAAVGGASVFLAVGWVVERLNRRAADQLQLERDELQALLDELTRPDGARD